jgi:hypothetical protein
MPFIRWPRPASASHLVRGWHARDVLAAGMRLEPTGRNPRHFTVGFDDLKSGVQRLVSCAHRVAPNAYHDA